MSLHFSNKSSWSRWAMSLALGALSAGCVEQSPDVPSEEDVKVAKENLLAQPPASMKFPVNGELEGKIVYLGMDVDTDKVKPGSPFTLTHYWKVNEPVGADWKLFVHLEAPGTSRSHLNADHVPIGGKYPVGAWKKGDIIRDAHRVSVPGTWTANAVEIYVGLWKGKVRLKTTGGPHDAENRVRVATIPVEGAAAATPVPAGPAKRIVATKVKEGAIKLDGKLDEAEWTTARGTGAFVKTLDGAAAESKAEAKVLWDDKFLYVAFQLEDKDVWATKTGRDDQLWKEEAVEVFIDADGDKATYVELQVNPKNAVFDSYLPKYRENQNDFDAGMKTAVFVDGTVDKRDDADKGWSVEMQIPLIAARGKDATMKSVPPVVGTVWRVNFFRMDMPAGKPQQGTSWSAPMVADFHALDKFGELVFGDDKGSAPASAAATAAPAAPAAPGAPAAPAAAPAAPAPTTAAGTMSKQPVERPALTPKQVEKALGH